MKEEKWAAAQAAGELAAMRQRIEELEALQRTSLQLTSSLNLSAVLDTIAESALALAGASDCLIYLYDEASETFAHRTALGRWAGEDAVLTPRPGGLTAAVVREGRPVVIDDAPHHPLYASPEAQEWKIEAIAGFPLRKAGRVLGVLLIVFGEAHTFGDGELRVLGLLADQAAIAIENSQLYAQAREEIAVRVQAEEELRRLQDFNEGIVQSVAESIYVLDAEGYLTFANRASADLLGYENDEMVGEHWTRFVPPDQHHLVEAARQRRVLGQSDRYELQMLRKDGTRRHVQASGSPFYHPSTGEYLGNLGVHTDLSERLRVEEELRKHRDHLEELVDERTAALTEANAKLQREVAERERAEEERERLLAAERAQARRQGALFRLSAELAATLDETEVCRRVVNGLRDTLGYDFVAFFLLDEASGDRVTAASVGFDEPPQRLVRGQGLSERPIEDGQLHYSPDVMQDQRYFYGMGGSEVDVPVRVGGEVAGVLVAENKERDAFDQDDFEVLTAASQQAGLAIEKVRLLAAERQRADELEALRTTMAEITAELELPTLLRAIVERATSLVDATCGELGLYDEAREEVRIVVSHNLEPDSTDTRHALGEGSMGLVAETREPLIVGDYQSWERRSLKYAGFAIRAALAAPLMVGGRLVGVIALADTDADRRFDAADLHLLMLFAQQAAIAIENARLFSETERRVTELATLTDVGRALSSTLHLDEVLQLIYDQTRRVMHAEDMLIALYDEDRHELECVFSTNPDDVSVGTQFSVDTGLVGPYIVKRRKPLLLGPDAGNEARELGLEPIGQPAASWLGVPVRRGERVLGAIVVQHYTEPDVYDESHQVLLESIAGQAAIAIENARLFEQAQREIAERERAEAELRRYQESLEERVEERTAELRKSEERYRSLFEGVPIGLYRSTPGGEMVDANLALVEMMGYPSREEYLEVGTASAYVDPEDRVRWQTLMEREGVVRDFECRLRRHDGTVIWANDTARAVRDEQGQVLHYEGSLEDITERKRAEDELRRYREHLEELVEARTAELRESEERYRTLFDGVPIGLYRTTPDGEFLDVNRAFVEQSGYPDQETLLAATSTSFYVDPEEQVRWRALMDREGIVRDFEVQVRHPDGTVGWANDSARAVRDEQGRVLYYEGSMEDITERKQFQEELRRQKDYFEALFLNNPVAVVTADRDANVVSWNPMAEKLFGYTPEEAIGHNLDDLVARDESMRAEAAGYSGQVLRQERVQVTTQRTRKDGSFVDVELLALPLILAGERVGFCAIYHDVTERRGFERELRHQKEYYEALFLNSPVAVVTIGQDGNVVSWNPAAEQLFGYTRAEAIGRNVDDLVATDDSIRAEASGYTEAYVREGYVGAIGDLSDLMDDSGRLRATTRRTHKDGSLVDVELLGLPVIVGGEEVGVIAIYHDVSERKRIERELRRQKEYYEALFLNSPVAVVTVGRDGNVVSWNPAAEQLFGYTQAEAIGQNIDDLVAIDDSIRAEAVSYTDAYRGKGNGGPAGTLPDLFDESGRIQATTRRTRKDGTLVDVSLQGVPMTVGAEGDEFMGMYTDISELQEARREAEAANQAKSTFLANMSHELRTPLNAILGFSQLMDDDPNLTSEQQENLAIINRSGEHLLSLINDVLETSKIEAGQVTLQETVFDLYDLLDSLEEMFHLRAEERGLTLSVRRSDGVPQHIVTDEGKLRQVLSNLLGNAVKFTREGGIALRVGAPSPDLPCPQARRMLRFEVEDTGPGIAPEELEAVFDPFVQGVVGPEPLEGTGLGLAISRQFVRLLGGDITASSELGRGSLFQFDVEVGLADASEAEVTWPRQRVLGLAPDQIAPDGGPFRLLVAEDRETNRRLLVTLLESLGFEVQEAADGQQAIEAWERWAPHLIWMDMRMPVMDGHEATQRIKAEPGGDSTVIIALTATAFEEDREQVLLEGCDDFVRKPFRKAEIHDMLAKHLGVRFLFEEEPSEQTPARPAESAYAPCTDALAAQPADWRAELQDATTKADLALIQDLIDQIREADAALADALADLAQDYQYGAILTLIDQAGG